MNQQIFLAFCQLPRDIFVSTISSTFGSATLDLELEVMIQIYTAVSMNGVNLNDMESGRVYWSSWDGLNDALRNTAILNGIRVT